jgi:transposase
MAKASALRADHGADDLRRLARASRDALPVRRRLALAAIQEGASRTEAARIGGVGLQIVRDWVARFNAGRRVLWTARRRASRRG